MLGSVLEAGDRAVNRHSPCPHGVYIPVWDKSDK